MNSVPLAFRMFKGQFQRVWVLVFCTAIGVCAYSAVSSFLKRVEKTLAQESRSLLAADIEIAGAAPLSDEQISGIMALLPAGSRIQQTANLLSMALSVSNRKSRLIEVQAVEQGYPFYGAIKVSGSEGLAALQSHEPCMFVSPELLVQMGISPGEKIKVGELFFSVKGIVEKEPGLGASPFSLGPKVFVGLKHLRATGLSDRGSRISYAALIALDNMTQSEPVASAIRSLLNVPDEPGLYRQPWRSESRLSVRTVRDKQLDLKRSFDRFEDYLRLAAFAVMIIAGAGVAVSVGGYVREQKITAASLRCLGFSGWSVVRIFLVQVSALGLAASLLGSVAGGVAQNLMGLFFAQFVPLKIGYEMDLNTFLKSAAMGWFVSIYFAAWSLVELEKVKPLALLRETEIKNVPIRKWLALFGAALFAAALLFETRSIKLASAVVGTLAAGGFSIWLAGGFLTKKMALWKPRLSWSVRLALSNLSRKSFGAQRVVLSLGIPVLFLGVVSIYQQSMMNELQPQNTMSRADLFLIDVQDDQVGELSAFFRRSNAPDFRLSPMVKARYRGLNRKEIKSGQPVTREGEQAERMRHREQNLSFRDYLSEDETIVKGRWIARNGETECSLEEWYARRIDADIGDRLTFDIQGVNIEAKVTSVRKVRWSGFRPNFFVLITPSAIADAPKTWVGSVAGLPPGGKDIIQSGLAEKFPNVTILDVSQSTAKVMNLLNTLSKTVQMIAFFALLAGWGVLVGMALSTVQQRKKDAVLLRMLGAKQSDLLLSASVEFLMVSLASASAASLLAVACGWTIITKLFDLNCSVPWLKGAGFAAVWTVVCVVTAVLSLRKTLRVKPLEAVRSLT